MGRPYDSKERRRVGLEGPALAGGELYGGDDLGIAGAAAEIAGEVMADVVVARIGILAEKVARHQHEAGRAIAALHRAAFEESFLFRTERAIGGKVFDRDDFGAVEEGRQVEAAGNRAAVDEHRAAAAQALAAALARAEQIE